MAGLTAAYLFWPTTYRGAPTVVARPLSPRHFTPLTVTASKDVGPNLKLITLYVPPESRPDPTSPEDPFALCPIWSLFVKDDDLQVERPYTPLEGIDTEGNVKLWVKRYPRGEVARWLHAKRPGDIIEVRGPHRTLQLDGMDRDEVVMISGGTGYAPFHQLLHDRLLLNQPDSSSNLRLTLLHGSRSIEELPPPEYLDPLIEYAEKYPDRLTIHLFVDEPPARSLTRNYVVTHGRIDTQAIRDRLSLPDTKPPSWWARFWGGSASDPCRAGRPFKRDGKILFAVCGPEPMIAAVAGPYGRNYSQGSVGGALAELGFKSGEVYKL
ncbi:unnamed protein product [Peniophora sp. CBMAI 1063]|nr:unnamed protein product [Peniophora sp. CBMAI 1063]